MPVAAGSHSKEAGFTRDARVGSQEWSKSVEVESEGAGVRGRW